MNAKKISRRERAAARFNIMTQEQWDECFEARSAHRRETKAQYTAYVERKKIEAKALGLKITPKIAA